MAAGSRLSEVILTSPPRLPRLLVYLLFAFICTALIWATLSKVDDIATVPAEAVPQGRLTPAQSPFAGVIREILVEEGASVTKGQPLVTLESKEVAGILTEMRKRRADLRVAEFVKSTSLPQRLEFLDGQIQSERMRLEEREKIHTIEVPRKAEEVRRLMFEVEDARGRLASVTKELTAGKVLGQSGYITERKLDQLNRDRDEADNRVRTAQSRLLDAQLRERQEISEFNGDRQNNLSKIGAFEREKGDLRTSVMERHEAAVIEFERARDMAAFSLKGVSRETLDSIADAGGDATNLTTITASEDGAVSELKVRKPGEAVEAGAVLLTLVPKGAPLTAEIHVPDKEIGRLAIGQTVRFKFEAFPFAEYGVLTGRIDRIGLSVVGGMERKLTGRESEPVEARYYPAFSTFHQDYFRVGDRQVRLLPGMKATAEIVTERRSVLALLFNPIKEFSRPQPAVP